MPRLKYRTEYFFLLYYLLINYNCNGLLPYRQGAGIRTLCSTVRKSNMWFDFAYYYYLLFKFTLKYLIFAIYCSLGLGPDYKHTIGAGRNRGGVCPASDNPRVIVSKLVTRLHFHPDFAPILPRFRPVFAPITQKSNEILFFVVGSFNFQPHPLRRCVERSEGATS